jgi:hypothetical protein
MNQEFPDHDGIVGLNVVNFKAAAHAFMLVGRKFFQDRLKRQLFHPGYRHFYADIELGMFAESLGKFKVCPEAKINHFHPVVGAVMDATHRRNRLEKWEADNQLFTERKCQK